MTLRRVTIPQINTIGQGYTDATLVEIVRRKQKATKRATELDPARSSAHKEDASSASMIRTKIE